MSKQGFFSGPCLPVFGLNTGKYGPGKTLYLDTFHAVPGGILNDNPHPSSIWNLSGV